MQVSCPKVSNPVKANKPTSLLAHRERCTRGQLQVVYNNIGLKQLPADEVPTLAQRRFYNLFALGGLAVNAAAYAIPYFAFFFPVEEGGGAGGTIATDKVGTPVSAASFGKEYDNNRSLVQGLKGDPTYIVVKNGGIEDFGINAVCTHLGCVVPWVASAEQFQCPCHGSRYNYYGKVVRGPAPLPLPLTHVKVENDRIVITQWTEEDFRTASNPWWIR